VHDKGVTNPPSGKEGTSFKDTSVPRTKLTPGAEDGMIPLRMLRTLRRELRRVYPELGEKDFVYTRLCWYVFTPHSGIPQSCEGQVPDRLSARSSQLSLDPRRAGVLKTLKAHMAKSQ
jgi:hypothetical protein